jgi:hypothetical protein
MTTHHHGRHDAYAAHSVRIVAANPIAEHRARETRLITGALTAVCTLAAGCTLVPALDDLVTALIVTVLVAGTGVAVLRRVARRVRWWVEDRADARTAAAWRAQHQHGRQHAEQDNAVRAGWRDAGPDRMGPADLAALHPGLGRGGRAGVVAGPDLAVAGPVRRGSGRVLRDPPARPGVVLAGPRALVVGPMSTRSAPTRFAARGRPGPPPLDGQSALFGDDPTSATSASATRAETNDLDLIASAIRTAADPGYVLIGPTERVYLREPGSKHDVTAVPRYEAGAVAQLIESGHLEVGGIRIVRTGDREGPARSVLVTKAARAMVARWGALHPLTRPAPVRLVEPPRASSGPVHVDVVAPVKALVTCGVGDWSGVIVRNRDAGQRGAYFVETEAGAVIGMAGDYRAGARKLARHHGFTATEVVIEHEKDTG